MAKNEYQIGDMKQKATVSRGFGPGGGHGIGGGEKAGDFGKAIGELASYCKNIFRLLQLRLFLLSQAAF